MRITRGFTGLGLLLAGLALISASAHAQVAVPPEVQPAPAAAGEQQAAVASGIDVTADRLEYEADRKLLVGSGNVVVKQGPDILSADIVTVHTETEDAYATGNVVFEREGQIWRGDELTYNFRTRTGNFGEFTAFVEPYYIRGDDSERVAADEYVIENATITPCEGDTPGFLVRASNARILHGTRLKARNVVIFLGAVPIMYLPFWSYDIGREKTNIDALPGYSSKLGAYLLLGFNYNLTTNLRAATHVDYYSDRGVGFGQDFKWRAGTTNLPTRGMITGYYIDDDMPYKDEEEELARADTVDEVENQRFRVRLDHTQPFTDRTWLLANIHYLSDPDILEDFFRIEYRNQAEPENRATLVHRGDRYTAGLQVNKRLNDFYENVDRVPELTLDFQRQQIADSRFYYQGENSASFLQRVYEEDSGDEDYEAFRADSAHTLYYPTKHFGFLNIIPRAGYRATYYSETREMTYTTNAVPVTDTNGVAVFTAEGLPVTTSDVQRVTEEMGADVRHRYELGVETSFKAFKVLKDPSALGEGGLRHVAEPYANYTFVPEPNLLPENLYQFDDIDEFEKEHFIRLGMRNKLQTKRSSRVADYIDADLYADYRLEPEEDEEDFGPLNFKVELSPAEWLLVELDGEYDWYGEGLTEINSQVGILMADKSSVSVEHRYRKDSKDEVQGEIVLFPEARWSVGSYMRYDLEVSQVQEQSYYIQHKDDCLGVTVGYSGRGDDWDAWLKLWLVAFPDAILGAEGHY
ncbi:MAG: LPS-assembly protein LptD [Kiritimatiellae bacterium]|nr:LPS-assembly protein LptD [Kiritimatiellia bacterium]